MTDPLLTLVAERMAATEAQRDIGLTDAEIADLAQAALSVMQEAMEQIVSAWAFAHDIDGAARNDLFARLRAARPLPAPPLEKM